eukprot:6455233-Amphidinium_carterae.1
MSKTYFPNILRSIGKATSPSVQKIQSFLRATFQNLGQLKNTSLTKQFQQTKVNHGIYYLLNSAFSKGRDSGPVRNLRRMAALLVDLRVKCDGKSQKRNLTSLTTALNAALGGVWREARAHAEVAVCDLFVRCGEAVADPEHIVHRAVQLRKLTGARLPASATLAPWAHSGSAL